MTEEQKASGQDLARQALAAYKAGRTPGTAGRPKPTRTKRTDRSGGRDPMTFAAIVDRLTTEQGWTTSVAGGSILDRFDILCPQYVGHVQAVAFDAERGCLDLKPASHPYATQLRMFGGQLCKQINDKLGTPTVRSIRVLSVGAIDTATPTSGAGALEPADANLGPVRTREAASPGYRRNMALHQEHKPETPTESPLITAARASLNARIADPSRREPETAFTDGVAAREHALTTAAQQDDAETLRQAAIRMARAQKAGITAPVRRAFEVAS